MTHSIRLDRRFAIIDEWLLDLPVSDRAIRLYAVLARYADNETHKAYPSRATLAERLNCSLASVDRASTELVRHGAMSKQLRANSSIVYTLHTMAPIGRVMSESESPEWDSLSPNNGVVEAITSDKGGSSPVTRGVLTGDGVTITTELNPENIDNRAPDDVLFDQFWAAYPRKLGTGEARQAFRRAVKAHGLDIVLEGVKRFAADPNLPAAQFIPRAATWLNQERWNDAPYEAAETGRAQERLSRSPYVGGPREWVKDLHNLGDHYECRPGEFGCKP